MAYCEECHYQNYHIEHCLSLWKCEATGNVFLPDGERTLGCEKFQLHQSCDNCSHAAVITHETGTIDCIRYLCQLQNGKEICVDNVQMEQHNFDFPQCPIGRWRKNQEVI